MKYVRELIDDTIIYPYTIYKMREDFPDTSFPDEPSASDLALFGIYIVTDTPVPSYDELTQSLNEGAPVKMNSTYKRVWVVDELTAEEITNKALEKNAIARAEFIANRTKRVSELVVITSQGNAFDGDETSQNRMARAIQSMDDGETTLWVLANNSSINATKAELREALRLAGQEQTNIWIP